LRPPEFSVATPHTARATPDGGRIFFFRLPAGGVPRSGCSGDILFPLSPDRRLLDPALSGRTGSGSNHFSPPEITVDDVRKYVEKAGELKPGEIVIFQSGHSDRHFKAFPEGDACLADPLNGKSEGWPAPGPDVVAYLAKKGILCVGTDGPTLGGVDPKKALMTYWALGSRGVVGVEYLTSVGKVPAKAYFIFAPVKISGCHGGPGRVIALY
jgi:hypothetical protein